MEAPTRRTLVFGFLAAHWIAEFAPIHETASRVVRLIVISVETLWFLWGHYPRSKRQRSTGDSAQE